MEPKTCATCEKLFTPRRKVEVCCSSKCSAVYFRRKNRPPSRAKQKACVICDKTFTAIPGNRKTCGDDCARVLHNHASAKHYHGVQKHRPFVSDEELERRLNEFWEREATPDYGRDQRTAIADAGAWA